MVADYSDIYTREKKVIRIIGDVEARGLRFDIAKAQYNAKIYTARSKLLYNKLESIAGEHNPNSPAQVLSILLTSGLSRAQLTEKGKLTTGSDVLIRVSKQLSKKHPAKIYIDALLARRSYEKTLGTYLIPLSKRAMQAGGIVYCQINPSDSRTGRMASRDPNLQNIPEPVKRKTGKANPVRSCFICRDGFSNYYFDYAQMELYIFGAYAQEKRILEPYESGEDVHGFMASYIYGKNYTKRQRDLTKNINFGKLYGLGSKTMSLMYDMTEAEANDTLKEYDRRFNTISKFMWQCRNELIQYGYVEDWFGKRYHIPVGQAYKAVNALVQGTCASLFKQALVQVSKILIPEKEHILLPIHDEIQIEVGPVHNTKIEKYFCKRVIDKMVNLKQTDDRDLALRVDVAKSTTNWSEKEKVEL